MISNNFKLQKLVHSIAKKNSHLNPCLFDFNGDLGCQKTDKQTDKEIKYKKDQILIDSLSREKAKIPNSLRRAETLTSDILKRKKKRNTNAIVIDIMKYHWNFRFELS